MAVENRYGAVENGNGADCRGVGAVPVAAAARVAFPSAPQHSRVFSVSVGSAWAPVTACRPRWVALGVANVAQPARFRWKMGTNHRNVTLRPLCAPRGVWQAVSGGRDD